MTNLGIHHVSSLVSDIHTSYDFYHNILGLKLLIKTINQDDTSMYHLFFSDETGQGGTEFTLFQINTFKQNSFGTNSIDRIVFALPDEDAMRYWLQRLDDHQIEHYGIEIYGQDKMIRFEDPDGLRLAFAVVNNPEGKFFPNQTGPISVEHAILGIHSVHLRVRYPKATQNILEEWFEFIETAKYEDERFPITVMQNDNGLFKHKIYLIDDKINQLEEQGIGGIHHLALYAETDERLKEIQAAIEDKNFENSGIVPREFINATYFREPNGLLFEVATKTLGLPKFSKAESIDDVTLYLPDFLEEKRSQIEQQLSKLESYR